MVRAFTVLVAVVVVLGGCGQGDDSATVVSSTPSATQEPTEPAESSTAPATSGETDTAEDAPGTGASGDSSQEPVDGTMIADVEPTSGGISFISDVRTAGHADYDRVVFEYENSVPGYQVTYVTAPIHVDPSGRETVVEGNSFVSVRMYPSSSVDLDVPGPEGYRESYTGPKQVRADTDVVTEVVEGTDFEAEATWIVGLDRPTEVTITTLEDPARLVLDFATN